MVVNVYWLYDRLGRPDPLLVGEVISHDGGDTSTVELPGGGRLRVRGQSVAIGSNAFVRSGRIEGGAPGLAAVTIDV